MRRGSRGGRGGWGPPTGWEAGRAPGGRGRGLQLREGAGPAPLPPSPVTTAWGRPAAGGGYRGPHPDAAPSPCLLEGEGQSSPPPPPSPVGTWDTPVRPSPLLGGSRPRGPPTVWWGRPQCDTARPPPRCWLARREWGEARGRLCPLRYRCLGTGWARGFVVHETCPIPRCTHTHPPQRGLSLLWGAAPRSGSIQPPASPWHSAARKLAVHPVLSPSTQHPPRLTSPCILGRGFEQRSLYAVVTTHSNKVCGACKKRRCSSVNWPTILSTFLLYGWGGSGPEQGSGVPEAWSVFVDPRAPCATLKNQALQEIGAAPCG